MTEISSLANRVLLWHRGALETLTSLEAREFTRVEPAQIFPRVGQVNLGGAPAVQHTTTTCGTTVLAMANALFDPVLRERLQHRNPDLRPSEQSFLAVQEFRAVQSSLLGHVTGRTWPRALGSPPWGLARLLRVPGVRYDHLPLDNSNAALAEVLTGLFQRALAAGIPVPLYVGGTLREKVADSVPRHVILLVPPAAIPGTPSTNHVRIYEPGSGRVYRREWSVLWHRNRPEQAFGGWSNLAWALLPGST